MKHTCFHAKTTPLRGALFTLLFALFWMGEARAQGPVNAGGANPAAPMCGVFNKLGGTPDGYSGETYYDRFGNTWTEDEIAGLGGNITEECTAGVFLLCFSGAYTPDERQQVCNAFDDLSDIVGGGGPEGIVPLKIEFEGGVGGAKASSFMRLECGSMKNFALINIRTKDNQLPLDFFAGMIEVDDAINWYTGPMPASLADWNTQQAGMVDLYTAILHEGLHILGIASTYGGVELFGGGIEEGYTDWDRYLYKRNGANDYTKLVISANNPECCGKQSRNPAAPTTFGDDCLDDIMFRDGVTDIAEVSRVLPNDDDVEGINNRLSHLDITCGSGEQYVMHPTIATSPDPFSFPRRMLTQAELDILCRVGYPAAGSCQNCVVVAEDDVVDQIIFLNGPNSNNPISIPIGPFLNAFSLLGNDVLPIAYTIELCGADPGISAAINGGFVVVSGLTPGNWTFCYRLKSDFCPNACDEATVHVTVLDRPVPTSCVSEDCNLICFGDFEGFESWDYHSALNIPPFYIQNSPSVDNSIDIRINDNNDSQILHWVHVEGGNWECPVFPLSAALEEGCTITISFEAAVSYLGTDDPLLNPTFNIYGLNGLPCGGNPGINEPSCPNLDDPIALCPGVQAICLGSVEDIFVDEDYDEMGESPTVCQNLNLESYTLSFTLPADPLFPITTLMFYGSEDWHYLIDNLSVTSSCNTQVNITPTVISQCIGGQAVIEYEVCLLGVGSNPLNLELAPVIPPIGFTVVPGGGFDANGVANFQLTPGTECNGGANTTTLTLTINVSPNFDPAQAPILIDIPMNLSNGGNLCIDPDLGENGDATLMLQDCTPAAFCNCPPNEPGILLGLNMDSETVHVPSVMAGTCIAINGRVRLNYDWTLTDCHVIMNRGAEIVVGPKATLTIEEGSLLEGCEHMWRSITVESGGTVAIRSGSAIRDAQWGVRALPGASVEITDSQFDACYTGIHVPNNVSAQAVSLAALTGNDFVCISPLKPAYTVPGNANHQQIPVPGIYTYAGIDINDVVGFDIGADNLFEGIRNGVVAERSAFTIKQCTLRNLVADPAELNADFLSNLDQHGVYASYCPLAEITYSQFLNFGKGIYSEKSNIIADLNVLTGFTADSPADDIGIECSLNTNQSVRIRSNTITTFGAGIYVSNALPASILRIKNNTVSTFPGSTSSYIDLQTIRGGLVSDNVLNRSDASAAGAGISMLNCAGIVVQSNRMYGVERGTSTSGCVNNTFVSNKAIRPITPPNTPPASGGLRGFSAYNSTDSYCQNRNEGQNEFGFYFEGMCIKNNALRCNIISDADDDGLNLWANGNNVTKIGTQTNGGNAWIGAYGDKGAYNAAATIAQDVLDSQFKIPANQIPTWSTGLGQMVLWFKEEFVAPPNCFTACPIFIDTDEDQYPTGGEGGGYGGQGDLGPADIISAQNGHYGAGYNWMARQRLYERLRLYPALAAQNTYVQQFYNYAPYTDLGQQYEVKQSLLQLQGRDAFSWDALRDLQQDIRVKAEALQALRLAGPGSNYNAWWLQVRQQQQALKLVVNQLRGHETWLEGDRQAELPSLLLANAGVSTNNVCALNQRTLNGIYAGNSLWRPNPLTSPALLQVKAIADQCPLQGGFAVYEARSLYRRFVPSATWSPHFGCGYLRPGEREDDYRQGSSSRFMVMPNPADDMITILPEVETLSNLSFELYSMMGQRVKQTDLPLGFAGVSISVSDLSQGIYLFKIEGNGKILQSGRIVIAH